MQLKRCVIKESDVGQSILHLEQLSSYMIIDKKFVRTTFSGDSTKLRICYVVPSSSLDWKGHYLKNIDQEVEFFGFILPNGEIEQLKISKRLLGRKQSIYGYGIFEKKNCPRKRFQIENGWIKRVSKQ